MVHVHIKTQKYKEIHQNQRPFKLLFRCFTAPMFKERKTLQPSNSESWSYLSFVSDSLIGSVSEQFILSLYLFVPYTALK